MPTWLDDWLAPPTTITDGFRYSNYTEGVVWISVGILSLFAARQRNHALLGMALLVIFIIFGVSDWVESTTGAWWFPLWLLLWEAACIVAVLGLVLRAKFATATSTPPSPIPSDQSDRG